MGGGKLRHGRAAAPRSSSSKPQCWSVLRHPHQRAYPTRQHPHSPARALPPLCPPPPFPLAHLNSQPTRSLAQCAPACARARARAQGVAGACGVRGELTSRAWHLRATRASVHARTGAHERERALCVRVPALRCSQRKAAAQPSRPGRAARACLAWEVVCCITAGLRLQAPAHRARARSPARVGMHLRCRGS